MPDRWLEIAFARDTAGFPLWTDVSEYVEWEKGVRISRRRSHELDETQPGTLALALINNDGRFTAGRAASPYFPNVTLNRPIRLRARWPASANLLLLEQARGVLTDPDTGAVLFSATQGTLTQETSIVPAGQTTAIRWAAGTLPVGAQMRVGSTVTTSATDQALNVEPGVTYSLRCQARRDASVAVTMAVRLRYYTADGVPQFDVTGTGVALTTAFQALSLVTTAPAGAAFARVVLHCTVASASAVVIYSSAWQLEEAAAPTAWVSPGVEYRRFTGFVDRWPHAWTNGVLGTVSTTATDRQKLLGRDLVRQAIVEETLATGPRCYYPLGEPQDSVQGGNVAVTPQPDMLIQQTGTGGLAEFGAKGGPDESTGVLLTPTDISNGNYLLVPSLTTPLGGVAGISIGLWVDFGDVPQTGQNRLIVVDNGTDTVHLRINYAPGTNTLSIGARLPAGAAAGSTTAFNLSDSQLHLIVVSAEFVGSTMQLRAYVDGVSAVSTSPALTGGTWPTLMRVRVGGLPGTGIDPPEMMKGLVSHVTCWNTVITQAQSLALAGAIDGFAGDLSGARATRIAGWAGVPSTAFDIGASVMARHPASEQSPLAAFKQVASSEAGLFFISGDDVATLHSRVRRQLAAPISITLAADQCGPDLQFVLDDTLLINDVSVSRIGRTVTRVIDQASIDENQGVYAANIDTLLNTDTEAIDRATYTLSTYGHPQPRAGQISVDAHSLGTVWPQMLGSEIGQRIQVTGLPAEALASSLELWCEGIEDTITDATWTFDMDTSPVRDTPVFILDDPTYGTLDTNYLGW
jgi:hypothetical protein